MKFMGGEGMKTLIVYSSKFGAAAKAVERLQEAMNHEAVAVNLNKDRPEDLESYDNFIIGSSVYGGKISKNILKFCEVNREKILKKDLGLFLVCGNQEEFYRQMENNFAEDIRNHAKLKEYLGYGYDFDRMNFFYRFIIRKIAKVNKSVLDIKEANVLKLASDF